MKKFLSLFFVFTLLVTAIPVSAANNDVNSVEISNGQFVTNRSLQETLDEYFSVRNKILEGNPSNQYATANISTEASQSLAALSTNQEVRAKEEERASAAENMAVYHNVHILNSQTTAYVSDATKVSDTVYKLSVYEWVWIQYDNGNCGDVDEMGYGTTHEMIMEKQADGSFLVVEDIYDDSDMTGVPSDTVKTETATEISSIAESDNVDVSTAANVYAAASATSFNVFAIKTYANKYVSNTANGGCNYESYNYTQYGYYPGKDCANYVSQCLYAGGLNMSSTWKFSGTLTGSKPEDYANPTGATTAWKGAISLYNYLVNTLGYSAYAYEEDNISPGNPIFLRDSSGEIYHTAICVGYNSSNVPVFNAHTNDRYKVPFSFFGNNNPVTVQCMSYPYPNSFNRVEPQTVTKQNICQMSSSSDQFFMLQVTSTNTYTFYTSKVGSTEIILNAVLYEYDTNQLCMQQLYTDANGGGISMQFSLAPGIYFLRISGTDNTTSGSYYLNYYSAH